MMREVFAGPIGKNIQNIQNIYHRDHRVYFLPCLYSSVPTFSFETVISENWIRSPIVIDWWEKFLSCQVRVVGVSWPKVVSKHLADSRGLGPHIVIGCEFIRMGIRLTFAFREGTEMLNVSRDIVLQVDKKVIITCGNHQLRARSEIRVKMIGFPIICPFPLTSRPFPLHNEHNQFFGKPRRIFPLEHSSAACLTVISRILHSRK